MDSNQNKQVLHITHHGDKGFDYVVPDPSFECCPDCLSHDHWVLIDSEVYSPVEATFEFECKNKIDYFGELVDCDGRVTIREGGDAA